MYAKEGKKLERLEWNGLKAEIMVRDPGKIKTMGYTCGNDTCKLARNHKCVCSCGGTNHALLFKEKNKLLSLDDYGAGNPLIPDLFLR